MLEAVGVSVAGTCFLLVMTIADQKHSISVGYYWSTNLKVKE